VIATMKTVFGNPFASARARALARETAGKMPLNAIKRQMEQVLHDITGIDIDRLLYKIRATHTVHELWMLRSDMYQTIAKQHSQTVAANRINSLIVCFSHWIAPHQLTPI
jgi:hypothetical protein